MADRIGEEYIIPTLGVWEHFDDIDFDLLPEQFVLKVKDKSKLDKPSAKHKLERCLKRNYCYIDREWPYKNVPPCTIAEQYKEKFMKFLLLGANFFNKGAQAMLFVSVSELRTRFPDAEIFFLTSEPLQSGFNFKYFYNELGWQYLKGCKSFLRAIARVVYWKIRGRKISLKGMKAFIKEVSTIDAFVDISGYALSSQRGEKRSRSYLDQIKIAKKFDIPYFIMPQSIGPFEYDNHLDQMERLLKTYLAYPAVIFPREEAGYKLLVDKYHLSNIKRSYDMVLQNKGIREELIFTSAQQFTCPEVKEGTVAIVPNMRNFDYKSTDQIVRIYNLIVEELQRYGKKIYLLRHSKEDMEACQLIFESLANQVGVKIISEDLNCIQFNEVISKFDYIIASRYHSIVQSYKNTVPAIVLGWAAKYHELLGMFEQERFMFDVRGTINADGIRNAIQDMDKNWKIERMKIHSLLNNYQNENCFDVISDYFNVIKACDIRKWD